MLKYLKLTNCLSLLRKKLTTQIALSKETEFIIKTFQQRNCRHSLASLLDSTECLSEKTPLSKSGETGCSSS